MSKLLHITPNVYPKLEVEHATKQIWKELSKDYEEYHIVGRSDDQHFHTEKEGKLYLHRVPKLGGNKSFLFTSFLIIYYLRKYKIDAMLSQCAVLGGIAGVLYGRIFRIPIMIEIHDTIYFDILDGGSFVKRLNARILKRTYQSADLIRVLNPLMKEMLEARIGAAKIVVIENRVNFSIFNKPKESYSVNDPINIISVGTFTKRKGYADAIKVMNRVRKRYNVHLTLIGGGDEKEHYIQLAHGEDWLTLIDFISQSELKELICKSDIYIQTSYREGMPRTILEAMALGMPIITSDAGVTAGSVEHKKDAMMFPAGDFNTFEKYLILLIQNDHLREELGKHALIEAKKRFDWNTNFLQYRIALRDMKKTSESN